MRAASEWGKRLHLGSLHGAEPSPGFGSFAKNRRRVSELSSRFGGVDTDLVTWVDDQLEQSELDDHAGLIVLAALDGDRELDSFLDTGESAVRERASAEAVAVVEAGGTFLRSITVEGFRGIGPAATLDLSPRPGLTIVAGRNGSGKSSFSEALELVLTGETYRWKNRSSQWREQWRNLHHHTARVDVRVVEEGSGPVTVSTSWADGETDVDERTTTCQRQSAKRQDGLGDLGWERPLEQFRPILSYEELGGMLEGSPSELHDAIAKVLGTEQLGDALKRIQVRLKSRKAPGDAATQTRRQLVAMAAANPDERAVEAARLLRKTSPDVPALRALATGSATVDRGPITALRGLGALEAPVDEPRAVEVAARLRSAIADLADAGAEVSDRQLARLRLLEQALDVHAAHGEMSCPVCHSATLDGAWASSSRALVGQQREELGELSAARERFDQALRAARQLGTSRPAVLTRSPLPELEEPVLLARDAWDAWAAAPQGADAGAGSALADHVELHAGAVAERVAELRVAAREKLAQLDDEWQPLATQIGTWCDEWEAWLERKDSVDVLAAAEKWLKDNDLRLKNERLAPIRDGAKAAWAKLRQESNVEIGNLTLGGLGNRRKVRIEAEIDGSETSSLAVLSQGELHALALSLFLPRATMAQSPFRFVVLDDPVQAMDPAKVDGLVDLLADLARTRQVIVLSHDDRLAAAVRRADLAATILEVSRGQESKVSVVTCTDPATRYISDAFGLLAEYDDGRLTEDALRRTVPGLLRFAVEAAARDRFFTQLLQHGSPLVDVEAAWQNAGTTRQKVSLAVLGQSGDNQAMDRWASPPYRKFALGTVGPGMHNGLKAGLDPRDAARDVERLVKDLRAGTP